MRRIAVLILFLSMSCASSGPQERMVSVDLLERQQRGRIVLLGTHGYVVRVANVSDHPIEVQTVALDPVTSDLEFRDASRSFNTTIEPGGTRDFELWVTVERRRNASQSYLPNIDSLHVTVAYSSEGKDYVDSAVRSISGMT